MGFKNPNRTGEKIFNELEKKFNNNLETISKGKKLYRVRIWEKEMQSDFTDPQMFKRPFGMSLYGRYDCFGENPLYMAEDIRTSLCEIKDEQSSKTGICAELKYDAKILDMCSENIIFELCNKQKESGRINEYIMPNFISECCKLIAHNNGIQLDGLKYKSSIHTNGVNYVFFVFGKGNFTNLEIIKNEEVNYHRQSRWLWFAINGLPQTAASRVATPPIVISKCRPLCGLHSPDSECTAVSRTRLSRPC